MKLFFFLFLFLLPVVYADTPPPSITLTASTNVVRYPTAGGGSSPIGTVFQLTAITSWDPAPTTTITCTSPICRLIIQDCNGSIDQCETQTNGRDWNASLRTLGPEGDITCQNDCTRFGVVEDTPFTPSLQTYKVGSRHFRACWYDTTLINCSSWARVHTYDFPATVPMGIASCSPKPEMVLWNKKCVYDQNNNLTPLILWINKDINLSQESSIILNGASIEFNSMNGNNLANHKVSVTPDSNIQWNTGGWYDQNYVDFRNLAIWKAAIAVFGFSQI